MALKDNFTNRYFKPDLVKSQMDLINQPTGEDAMADGLQKLGSQPANGKAQRMSNALMTGMGSGLKASANDKRQEQIDPLLKMTGELNARSSYLEAQMQEEQKKSMQVKQLFSQNSHNLMNFSAANLAKDSHALNEVAPTLLRSYKQMFGDQTIGSYSHTHDGTIFYENNETGKIEGVNIANVIAQSGIDPVELFGDNAGQVMSGLSSGSREKHENTQELQRQQLEKGQADINNVNSQANYHNAQSGKIENDIANPSMSKNDELTFKLNSEGNNKHLNDLKSHITEKDLTTKILVLEKIDKLIENESSAGGSPKDMFYRSLKKLSGKDEKLTEAKMLQKYFFADIKGIAGNPNAKEWDDLVSRIVSPEQNVNASRSIIEFEKNQAQNAIHEYQDYAQILSEDNPNNLSHHHPEITQKIESNKDSRQFVMMVDPETGEQDKIKKSDIKEAENAGLRLVNE